MPLLAHLSIGTALTGQNAQMLAAVRLDSLRSLDVRMDLCHAWLLQRCTQLKSLTLLMLGIKGASAIAQLTGLTQLKLGSPPQTHSDEGQSELGSALAALSNLQSLRIHRASSEPVSQALSQLTALTELTLYLQAAVHNSGPFTLPSCVKLTLLYRTAVQHLANIQAPKLQCLDVDLAVKPSDFDALRQLCRGVLRACSNLSLNMRACSKEDTVALMAMLSQDWQPFAEAPQPIRNNGIGLEWRSTSTPLKQWSLQLSDTHCSCQCLELLPKGLRSLSLWWVPCILATRLYGLHALASATFCNPSHYEMQEVVIRRWSTRTQMCFHFCLILPQCLHPGP
jgi:hypothetical protein